MRKGYVSPSLMCVDLMNVQSDIEKLEKFGVDYFHVDMMDNHFVPNITLSTEIITALKKISKTPLDIHMMIEHPEQTIPELTCCDENDIILIFDEIQCGMGRSGEMFAWQGYGVKPDIMTSAKALGCGVPVGAFLMTERIAEKSLKPGDHGTTYGGNPFVGAAVSTVLDIFEELNLPAHVKEISAYLEEKLDALVDKYDCLTQRRGVGLIQGVVTTKPVGEITSKALEEGLLIISAGSDVLRFVPPLVIEKEHVDEMIEKLDHTLAALSE